MKETGPSELRNRERESTSQSEGFKETPLSREPLRKQDFDAQTQPVVSSYTQIPNASTTIGRVTGLPPPSFPGDAYKSTSSAPFYPPNSVPPLSSSVEPRLMNQSHASTFSTVSTSPSSVYVPSIAQQLPFS